MTSASSGEFYARAAFETASLNRSELERWRTDLGRIADAATDAELMASLGNGAVTLDAKKALLEERLKDIVPPALNLAFLLMTRDKLKIAAEISQQYDRLLDDHYGIEHAEVVAALPLDEEVRRKISCRLEQTTGRKFAIEVKVDPAILGGLIVKIGDTLIDRSLRGKLEALRQDLVAVDR
ncbi:MAG: ATP synthase F1 subunit delta [Chloroflexi bacterium]|nr:ATP synthase F1 subunit delta [Chloroflexota bacterium]MCK4581457.1 ATP synthase F1 subunit delta [Dehalococcoidia bacterium]